MGNTGQGAADLRTTVYSQHPSTKHDTCFLGNHIDSTGGSGGREVLRHLRQKKWELLMQVLTLPA